ncbi:homoserine dehydrogenase [Aquimarina muelleri]|uniref:Homoserine dehydrogenase n=2 Tax=Aquimarina muelleri TaxID=279356 RepID=A0A918N2S2_9FLAO|nr:homoserine dehydrogenase [Aquimarina muelleri]
MNFVRELVKYNSKMNIGIIGLGTVSRGFLEILQEKTNWVSQKFETDIKVVAIKDIMKGNMYNPKGIDINILLQKLDKGENINDDSLKDEHPLSKIEDIDLIIEASYSDYKTGDPAYTFIKDALSNGKHVVTTNKGPVALHYTELNKLAIKNNVSLRYEGTVLSGTPTFSLIEECLAGDDITEIRGILNGTSNYILSKMAGGESFENALGVAQQKGYAEADPTNDVKGYDARGKVAILSHKVFGVDLGLNSISTKGIDAISKKELDAAKKEGKNIRLIGSLKKTGNTIEAKVQPEALGQDDALSNIDGVTNAIEISTVYLGKIMITGPGAGKLETGYSVFSDVLSVIKNF